jgi:hypothetical protein
MTSVLQQHVAQPEADPAHELFDIVDDSGNVIGQEARAIVHKLGLLHRAGESTACSICSVLDPTAARSCCPVHTFGCFGPIALWFSGVAFSSERLLLQCMCLSSTPRAGC